MKDYDPAHSAHEVAVRLGPERIAFVLSVIVLIAAALLIGSRVGAPTDRTGSSTPSPTPRATADLVVVSVPREPAGAQA